jgi:deoxyribodipyrimidine photo-lyase
VTCRLLQVEGEAVVPVEVASEKSEYAARTLRPRIHRHLGDFLHPVRMTKPGSTPAGLQLESFCKGLDDPAEFLKGAHIDRQVGPVTKFFRGGPSHAAKHLETFLEQHLSRYDDMRNQPQTDYTSCMSPYLHYGMISPVTLALSVMEKRGGRDPQAESYVEELVVRRGLSQNFCHFNDDYDSWSCLPEWARKTLDEHKDDPRSPGYTREQLDNAETHDPYWNAAQVEMVETGYMHNYMRMYWGKKILEWSSSPQYAHQTTLYLNNRYFLDGRDPVSFANVAWIFGQHDRAWQERPVFGKIRCMMASGLERKNDPRAYVEKVQKMTGRSVRGRTAKGETLDLF